jgi:hypothetical protein
VTPDHIKETALIEASRIQRETLERWFRVMVDAGEIEEAERLRADVAELINAETAVILPFPAKK